MQTVAVKFRNTIFDITHDDGIIESIIYNGQDVKGLMFDMGFIGDITTALLETIASDEVDAAQYIECPDCEGEGQWYNDTSSQCTTRMNDCCGGCGYYVPCENCNETGLIEKEEEDEI